MVPHFVCELFYMYYTNSFKSSDTYYYSTSLSQDIISMKNRGVKYDE